MRELKKIEILARTLRQWKGLLGLVVLCGSMLLTEGCRSGTRACLIDLPSSALETAVVQANSDPLIQSTEEVPEDWWVLFHDDQLTEFIEIGLTRNPTLHTAQAKILLASASAATARAMLYPQIFWGADVLREKLSETAIIPFNSTVPTPGGVAGIPVYFTQYETQFNLSYDFDVWDKNRNTLRAALGEIQARVADEAFSRMQLSIAIAQVYFQLQVEYKRQEILQALVNNQTNYYTLIQQRLKNNLNNKLTLYNAQENIVDAKQRLLEVQGDIAIHENQLRAYLAGNFEEDIYPIKVTEQPLPKVPLPKNLPLHLIAYRPDITAQLWLIESAGKQIDVARAGFYPDFNLTALFGFQTIHLDKLFDWRSSYYNVNPAVSLPVFDGGLLRANLRTSEINFDIAIFKYNELVLNATREVLDGIAILRNLEQQYQEFKRKLNYVEDSFSLVDLQVKHGLVSNLDRLTNEEIVLVAKDQEVIALGRMIQAMISLLKALGGGYVDCYWEG